MSEPIKLMKPGFHLLCSGCMSNVCLLRKKEFMENRLPDMFHYQKD
jgi:hypothetical protein